MFFSTGKKQTVSSVQTGLISNAVKLFAAALSSPLQHSSHFSGLPHPTQYSQMSGLAQGTSLYISEQEALQELADTEREWSSDRLQK